MQRLTITHLALALVFAPAFTGALSAQPPAGGAAPVLPDDAVVRAIRDSNPTAPDALMYAAKAMLDYGRPDQAKLYVQKLMTAGLDRDALLALEKKFGTAVFLQMARAAEMQPEGGQLAQAVFAAGQQAAGDVPRLEALVKQLSSPSLGARTSALNDLRAARFDALRPLLGAMADKARAAEHPYVRAALSRLELEDAQPLLGALGSPDAELRIQVMEVLGAMRAREAAEHLIAPYIAPLGGQPERDAAGRALQRIIGALPTPAAAELYLRKQTNEYLAGMQPAHVDIDDMVTLWGWDAGQQTTVPLRFRALDAPLVAAARTAEALLRLDPANAEHRRLFLTCALEAAKMVGGLDRPLQRDPGSAHAAAVAAGPEAVEDVLAFAMKDGRIGAALASAEILGEIGSAELLFSGSGYPRPLGDAMQHGDRRLRVAAARAVVKLDPDTDFPAASRVPEVLAFVAGTAGMRKVLVADPRSEAAQTLVGLAAELGYDGEAAYTGYHAIKVALAEPDFALVLISDTLDYCDANELYQMLRKDPRTARLPIGLIVREENRDRWQAQLAKDPLAQAFPRPFDADTMSFFTRRLLIDVGRMAIGDAERMAQASQALDDLLKLAEQPQRYNFYDLIRHEAHIERALFTPELTEKAARLLGLLGTPSAQKSLVNRASQNATDLAGRQAAAEAFAEAVSLRGTLLTIPDIKLQYERYNQSEQLDAGTQEVLASILDAIEQRARDAK